MRYETSDKLIAWLTLFSGLTISAVAIYYSVAGLVAIFSAAVIPIIVMGVALEVSKLAATVWLKQNWSRAPNFIRAYLLAAIAILMLITSMGIFGFLSKAHSDQSLVSGDVQSKIAIYDEKIKAEKENIEANRKALKQMDEGVDQILGRSTDEKGADKAVALRRAQQKERARLQAEILQSQKSITELNDARAPIAAEVRKVEAEVGPIKYIANFIYGDNPDANILEKAVTWVIIIIVIVFDPLAVILLLASQYSFAWFRQQKEEPVQEQKQIDEPVQEVEDLKEEPEQEQPKESFYPQASALWPFPSTWENKVEEPKSEDNFDLDAHARSYAPEKNEELDIIEEVGVEQWNKMISEAEEEILREKEAKRLWKEENPTDTIKHQEQLKAMGVIDELPWEDRLKPDLTEVIEPDGSKKKKTYIVKENNSQITKTKE